MSATQITGAAHLSICVPQQQQTWHLQVTLDVCPCFSKLVLYADMAIIGTHKVGPANQNVDSHGQDATGAERATDRQGVGSNMLPNL
jgi:hypothetical protein